MENPKFIPHTLISGLESVPYPEASEREIYQQYHRLLTIYGTSDKEFKRIPSGRYRASSSRSVIPLSGNLNRGYELAVELRSTAVLRFYDEEPDIGDLPDIDPKGYIRLSVKILRDQPVEGESSYTLFRRTFLMYATEIQQIQAGGSATAEPQQLSNDDRKLLVGLSIYLDKAYAAREAPQIEQG